MREINEQDIVYLHPYKKGRAQKSYLLSVLQEMQSGKMILIERDEWKSFGYKSYPKTIIHIFKIAGKLQGNFEVRSYQEGYTILKVNLGDRPQVKREDSSGDAISASPACGRMF